MNKNIIKRYIILCLVAILITIFNYVYAAESVILGDINRDEKVDSMDLLYIMRHIIAESSEEHKDWLLEGERFKIADMTENGKVDSSDMLVILRYIAANNNSEEIGKKHPEWLEQKEIELKSFSEIKEEAEAIKLENDKENSVKEENIIENKEEKEYTDSKIKTIKLNKSLIETEKGTTEQIIATIEPRELSNEKITWRTVNSRIAEVDEQGKITAKENGETLLIARTEDGKEAVSKVIVGTKIREIVIDKEEVKIDLSERRTEKIEIKVEPEEASNKEITVESSNGNVAAIDGEGKITARANGETELTIKTSNGIEKKVKVAVTTSATGIKLDKNYVQLDLSNNKQSMIKATLEPSTASNKEITYMSSNEEIATVDKEGKITAKGNGEANIIARTSNGKEAVCKVEVKTEATEIEMEEEVKIDLSKEKEKKITVEVKPNNAKTKAVMIRSNNEEVATIDANGTIKAKKNGTAIITAEVVGTDISKTCKVIVTTSPTGLKLNKTSVNLDLSGTKTTKLTAEVQPSTASNKKIEWSSSNSNVITVDNAGNVIAKKNGTANIIAKIKETNISKTCKVIVETSPTGIKLSKTSVSLDMSGTKIVQLTATVLPDTASNKTATWSSSNTSIVSVDKNGKVTAKKNGTATITVKTVNGKVTKCTTKVTTSATGINLNKTSITIDNGKSTTLTATVLPSTASNKTVTWSSSNTSIVTVDKNGKITGKKVGTATITAKTNNGKKASCKITVKQEEIVASSKQIPVTQSYINHLKQKVIYYDYKEDSFMKSGNHTNYVCMVDVGQCRLTIFKKINGNWEVAKIDNNRSCIWNTYQGVRNSTTRAEMSGWRGPRSASFKTATRIIDKHPTADGNKWISCFVGPNPKYNLADPRYGYTHIAATVQRFEYAPRLKDPNNVPLSQRYYSMGCTVVNEEAAYYVYKNIPSDSTVVIFDENNPLPLWYAWDNASSGCSYTPRKDVPYSISLSPTSTELKVGQTKNAKITINPGNASHRGITYNSSNNKVATVDKNGKITAKSKGTTTITARVLGLTAKCKVEVK